MVVPRGHTILTFAEAFSWRLSQLSWGDLARRTAADVHPPLYYLLLKLWVGLFGDSVAALRGFSALLEIVAIVAVFAAACAWGRPGGMGRDSRRAGYAAGLLAALLLALNPLQVTMGLNTRMYALGIALSAIALTALGTALGDPERSGRAWFVYLIAASASLWTHNFALFTIAAQSIVAAVLILLRRRDDEGGRSSRRRDLKRLILVTLGIGLFYTPWVAVLAWQVRDVAADYWIQSPEQLEFVIELTGWASGARNLGFVERLAWCVLPAGLVIAALLRKDFAVLGLLVIALLPWAGCLAAQWLLGRPLYQLRYLSFAQAAWMVFLGLGTVRLPNRLTRWTVAIALVATAALGLTDWAEQVRQSTAGPSALAQAIAEGFQAMARGMPQRTHAHAFRRAEASGSAVCIRALGQRMRDLAVHYQNRNIVAQRNKSHLLAIAIDQQCVGRAAHHAR